MKKNFSNRFSNQENLVTNLFLSCLKFYRLLFLEKFIVFEATRNFFFLDIYSSTAAAFNSVYNCFYFL